MVGKAPEPARPRDPESPPSWFIESEAAREFAESRKRVKRILLDIVFYGMGIVGVIGLIVNRIDIGGGWPRHVPRETRKTLDRRGPRGETDLHLAARDGDVKKIKKLLRSGASDHIRDDDGWTPFARAVLCEQFDAADALLEGGSQINTRNREERLLIVEIAMHGKRSQLEFLIDRGAVWKDRGPDGGPLSEYAKRSGNADTREYLRSLPGG